MSKEIVASGKAFDKFLEIVQLQGGNVDLIKHPEKYPKSKIHETVIADKSGYLQSIDNYQIGIASLELGAGRLTMADKIDPKAGIIFYPKIGERIKKGSVIAEIFTDKKEKVDLVKNKLLSAIKLSKTPTASVKLVKKLISSEICSLN